MRREAVVTAVLAAAPAAVPAASAAVRVATFTQTVVAGDYASLTVRVSPRARCTITVVYTLSSHTRAD
jgi:hypothetical protein